MKVGDIEYTIESFLVCDMKCLVKILGLYDVFHPKSHYKCIWCNIVSTMMGDFTVKSWPLRDIQQMLSHGQTLDGKSDNSRGAYAGQKGEGVKVSNTLI